jgi:hypothetical protein
MPFGRLAQLVRALPSHGRGQRFESSIAHHFLPIAILAEKNHGKHSPYDRVSRFEPVAGGRCVSEFCGGAGCISRFGKPGPGGSHGGFRVVANAFCWSAVRIVFLVARAVRTRTPSSLVAPAPLCVALMILLTVVSQHAVSPKMAALRVQMGSIQATAAESPLLVEFARLHRISASLEGGVILLGFAALFLVVREMVRAGQ